MLFGELDDSGSGGNSYRVAGCLTVFRQDELQPGVDFCIVLHMEWRAKRSNESLSVRTTRIARTWNAHCPSTLLGDEIGY